MQLDQENISTKCYQLQTSLSTLIKQPILSLPELHKVVMTG